MRPVGEPDAAVIEVQGPTVEVLMMVESSKQRSLALRPGPVGHVREEGDFLAELPAGHLPVLLESPVDMENDGREQYVADVVR